MRNNQEIPIFRIVNTPYVRLTGSTPYLTSVNILNRPEKWKIYFPCQSIIPVKKLENDQKYDQVAIKYLKEVWLGSCKVLERKKILGQTKLSQHPPPTTSQTISTSTHQHPPAPTTSQNISTTIHDHPPTAIKIFIRKPFIRISSNWLMAT